MRIDSSGNIYGTAAELAAISGNLANNVFYYETDTGKLKVGNGQIWANTAYKGGGGGMEYTAIVNNNIILTNTFQSIVSYTPTKVSTVNGWIDVTTLQSGDIILIQVLYNGKIHSIIQYNDQQNMPMLAVKDITVYPGDTYSVEVKQTAGSQRNIAFKFYAGA